jgi:hypothetical protein
METLCYSIEYFHTFAFDRSFILNQNVKKILDDLECNLNINPELLDAPSLTRVDSNCSNSSSGSGRKFKRSNSSNNHRGLNRQYAPKMHDNLDPTRKFKVTNIEKKDGLEKQIGEIRGLLNKLSDKNYALHSKVIITALNNIMETLTDPDDDQLLTQSLFQIMSSNVYLSTIYADLYVELVGIYDMFGTMIDGFVESYKSSLNNICYINPDVDYDGFCAYNKINDARKCKATFIANLMKRDMISHDCVLNIIHQFMETVRKYVDEENRQNEVEEITENIVLLIKLVKPNLENTDAWTANIRPGIDFFLGLNVKDHASFTSRAKFKYMDCK